VSWSVTSVLRTPQHKNDYFVFTVTLLYVKMLTVNPLALELDI